MVPSRRLCGALERKVFTNNSKKYLAVIVICVVIVWILLSNSSKEITDGSSFKEITDGEVLDFVHVVNRQVYKNAFKTSSTVYIICNIDHGGVNKYEQDLIRTFPGMHFVRVSSRGDLMRAQIRNCDIVFINHLIATRITIPDILEIKASTGATLVAVAHDFYWLSYGEDEEKVGANALHGSYLSHKKLPMPVNELFLVCHSVVFVSEFARAIFANLYTGSNLVSVHPIDYAISRDKVVYPKIENRIINIGHFLDPTVAMGIDAVLLLRSRYATYRDYEVNIKITGLNGIPKYEDNMRSFYSLLESERIHGLLYLSRWGETFSFAMTKYLNSKLPILYNNFGAFKERLADTVGTFAVYQEEAEFDELLATHPPKYDLKSIIAEMKRKPRQALYSSLKQTKLRQRNLAIDNELRIGAPRITEAGLFAPQKAASDVLFARFESFLDTIIENNGDDYAYSEPKEEISPFFSTLFQTNFTKENLVLITSKIRVSEASFSYVSYRSVYSLDERFQQTVQTINSIRSFIPNSCIVLIDNSEDLPPRYTDYLHGNVDAFVTSSSKTLKYFTDVNKFKAFAELAQMIELYNVLLYRLDVGGFKNVFKISGRYTVLPTFDIEQYNALPNTNVFKRDESFTDRQYYYTCFYKISPCNFHAYFQILKGIFASQDVYISQKMLDFEVMVPRALNYSFTQVKKLGIRQNVAVWNVSTSI